MSLGYTEIVAIRDFFGPRCEVIAEFYGKRDNEAKDVEESVIEMAKRRPVTILDMANALGISETNAESIIKRLKTKGIVTEKQYGTKNIIFFRK